MALKSIGPVEKFPVGKSVLIEVEGKRLAVINTTGQYYAIDDTCPHRGGSFSLGVVSGSSVRCPLHGATVDVRTGSCSPPSPSNVTTYDVSCDGKQMFVDLG